MYTRDGSCRCMIRKLDVTKEKNLCLHEYTNVVYNIIFYVCIIRSVIFDFFIYIYKRKYVKKYFFKEFLTISQKIHNTSLYLSLILY